MRRLHTRGALLVLAVVCAMCGTACAAGKPIAIVASGNSAGGDVKFFRHYVTTELGIVTEERGEFLAPAEFDAYSLVAWFRSSPRAFTPGEVEAMVRYMEQGGHVLMTNGGVYVGLGRVLSGLEWIKAKAWSYNRHNWDAEVLAPGHPYLAGVAVDDPSWRSTYHALVDHEGVRLLGTDTVTTLGYSEVGKGRFIFSSYGPYDARDEARKAAYMQIYRNIVAAADPLTEHAQARALIAAAAPGRTTVLWQRDWAGSNERRLLWQPAGPRPGELLDALDLHLVRDEIDTTFFCVQSVADTGPLTVQVEPLRREGNAAEATNGSRGRSPSMTGPNPLMEGERPASRMSREVQPSSDDGAARLTVLVMGQAPLIPRSSPKQYEGIDLSRRGPFYLVPPEKLQPEGRPAFDVAPYEPRTVWIQTDTRGLPAGDYESRIRFSTTNGTAVAELPIHVRVPPIRMPSPRIVQLRTWGASFGSDPRLVREMARQGCDNGVVAYVDIKLAKLRNSDVTLAEALRHPARHLRGKTSLPRLDFTDCWNDHLDLYMRHGLTHITYKDARTGAWWATAVTGEKGDVNTPFSEWPVVWREALTDYYRQVQDYFHERGFGMVFPIWTDEPSMAAIQRQYLPLAKAYVAAGMGPGSHWTTYGWMTPGDANTFLPWTRDVSMYQYGYPNLQRFLREGSVSLAPGTIVGFTRGGTGLAVRDPHVGSRLGPWGIIHQREPAHFWRTGPIWKGWLYYVDFTGNQWFRLGGVQGERLVAYGSSDLDDMSADVFTSSDWEGARDGVDDANLARMVEWYLSRMKVRARGGWQRRLAELEAERERWFTEESPFPMGSRPSKYHHEPADGPALDYRIRMVSADSTRDIMAAKKYMIGVLEEMRDHAAREDVQVRWHDVVLVRDGKPAATIVVASGAAATVKRAAQSIAERVRGETGVALPVEETDHPERVKGVTVLVGVASDQPVADLLRAHKLQLDEAYPGKGEYRIVRVPGRETVAVLGVDAAGAVRGAKNWGAFLFPEGHWLLPQ